MSGTKRSDALKSMLAASIRTAADTPSDLTIVGAGKAPEAEAPSGSQESGVGSRGLGEEGRELGSGEPPPSAAESTIASESTSANPPARENHGAVRLAPIAPSFAPRPPMPTKAPAWAKLTITLEQSDFDVLDRFHAEAREAGVKLRRGGNPSLFIRAALRAFDELSEEQPNMWAQRVAAVIAREGP